MLSLMICMVLMGPRWTGRQRAMTQGWCQRGALLCNALQTDHGSFLTVGGFYYSGENNALATEDNAAYCLSPFPHISMQKNARMH